MRIKQVLSIFYCSLLVALLARRSLSCQKAHTQHHHNIHHPHNNVHSNHVQYKSQPPTECGYCARIWFQRPVSIFNRWCTVRLRPSVLPIYFPLSVLVGYYGHTTTVTEVERCGIFKYADFANFEY